MAEPIVIPIVLEGLDAIDSSLANFGKGGAAVFDAFSNSVDAINSNLTDFGKVAAGAFDAFSDSADKASVSLGKLTTSYDDLANAQKGASSGLAASNPSGLGKLGSAGTPPQPPPPPPQPPAGPEIGPVGRFAVGAAGGIGEALGLTPERIKELEDAVTRFFDSVDKGDEKTKKAGAGLTDLHGKGVKAFEGLAKGAEAFSAALEGMSLTAAIEGVTALSTAVEGLLAGFGEAGLAVGGVVATITAIGAAAVLADAAIVGLTVHEANQLLALRDLAASAGLTITQMHSLRSSFVDAGGDADSLARVFNRAALRIQSEWPAIQRQIRDSADNIEADLIRVHEAISSVQGARDEAAAAPFKVMEAQIGRRDAERAFAEEQRNTRREAIAVEEAILGQVKAVEQLHAAQRGVTQAQIDSKNAEIGMQEALLNEQRAVYAVADAQRAVIAAQNETKSAQLGLQSATESYEEAVYKYQVKHGERSRDIAYEQDLADKRELEHIQELKIARDAARARAEAAPEAEAKARLGLQEAQLAGPKAAQATAEAALKLQGAGDNLEAAAVAQVAAQLNVEKSRLTTESAIAKFDASGDQMLTAAAKIFYAGQTLDSAGRKLDAAGDNILKAQEAERAAERKRIDDRNKDVEEVRRSVYATPAQRQQDKTLVPLQSADAQAVFGALFKQGAQLGGGQLTQTSLMQAVGDALAQHPSRGAGGSEADFQIRQTISRLFSRTGGDERTLDAIQALAGKPGGIAAAEQNPEYEIKGKKLQDLEDEAMATVTNAGKALDTLSDESIIAALENFSKMAGTQLEMLTEKMSGLSDAVGTAVTALKGFTEFLVSWGFVSPRAAPESKNQGPQGHATAQPEEKQGGSLVETGALAVGGLLTAKLLWSGVQSLVSRGSAAIFGGGSPATTAPGVATETGLAGMGISAFLRYVLPIVSAEMLATGNVFAGPSAVKAEDEAAARRIDAQQAQFAGFVQSIREFFGGEAEPRAKPGPGGPAGVIPGWNLLYGAPTPPSTGLGGRTPEQLLPLGTGASAGPGGRVPEQLTPVGGPVPVVVTNAAPTVPGTGPTATPGPPPAPGGVGAEIFAFTNFMHSFNARFGGTGAAAAAPTSKEFVAEFTEALKLIKGDAAKTKLTPLKPATGPGSSFIDRDFDPARDSSSRYIPPVGAPRTTTVSREGATTDHGLQRLSETVTVTLHTGAGAMKDAADQSKATSEKFATTTQSFQKVVDAFGGAVAAMAKLFGPAPATEEGHASGGYISGAGGPRDDLIPAMLSDGEYVVQARAVKHFGVAAMHAINNMTAPRRWLGGLIDSFNLGGLAPLHMALGGLSHSYSSPNLGGGAFASLDLRTDVGRFPVMVHQEVLQSMSASALSAKLVMSGTKPRWFK